MEQVKYLFKLVNQDPSLDLRDKKFVIEKVLKNFEENPRISLVDVEILEFESNHLLLKVTEQNDKWHGQFGYTLKQYNMGDF